MTPLVLVDDISEVSMCRRSYIVFCRNCERIIANFSSPLGYPSRMKCPKCQTEGELCYRRKWNGELRRLNLLTLCNVHSEAGR